ncbi:MAG: YceI family protein, partial [Pseudomonadota bacterium]
NLTVKQVTRPITLSGRIVRSNRRRVVAELTGTIDRTAFGITAGQPFYGPTATVKMRMVASLPRRR